MAIKPTSLPVWDTSETNIVAPGSGAEQLSGWATSAQPPSSYFNWFQNLTYKWLNWVNATSPLIPIARGLIGIQSGVVTVYRSANIASASLQNTGLDLRIVFTEAAADSNHVGFAQISDSFTVRTFNQVQVDPTYIQWRALDGTWADASMSSGNHFVNVLVFGNKP